MLNPSLPIGRTGLVAWPKPTRNRSPVAPIGPFNDPFRAHVLFMLSDARAEEYFLIEAEVNPDGADLRMYPIYTRSSCTGPLTPSVISVTVSIVRVH